MNEFHLMVRLIEELSKLNIPIIFKGAVVLKTALLGTSITTDRETHDIDGDWVETPPTMQQLEDIINAALCNITTELVALPYREYRPGRSAGFKICDQNKMEAFRIDISIKPNPYYCSYMTVNGIRFNGASPAKMFADKMHGISTNKVFRRLKDVFDLFLLSSLTGYNTQDTYIIYRTVGRELGDFDGFTHRIGDLKHAYEKLHGITNKPDFHVVYDRVYLLAEPFIVGTQQNLTWNGYNWVTS